MNSLFVSCFMTVDYHMYYMPDVLSDYFLTGNSPNVCLFPSFALCLIIIIIIRYCIIQHIQSNNSKWRFNCIVDSYISCTLHLTFIRFLSHKIGRCLVCMIHRKETSHIDKPFGIVNHVCYNDYAIHHHHHLSLHLRCTDVV